MDKLPIIGQMIFGLYFLQAGLNHFLHNKMLIGYVKSKKIPRPRPPAGFTGLILVAGSLAVLTGRYLEWGLGLLAVFLLIVSFTMHNFWANKNDQEKMMNMVNFMKNMALLGAILFMYGVTNQWPWTL